MNNVPVEMQWIQIINTVGVVGVLFYNVWMFATGKIMPESVVNKILEENRKSTTAIAAEIKDGIKEAVREAIVQGLYEINKSEAPPPPK